MTAVLVPLLPRREATGTPAEATEIEFVDDLDSLTESDKCACAASDDNPF
ncbi:hypothetical protein [Streptomyces boncukensis]|uniref:Uncharacterized protein n=1 Tax=Streptomyces boncukensis TaxID=2711219 RepID=A0A6G4WSN3_9ACTN|nr:hypothetical protein [Streptomyces boncukensis]NGO67637.1 hypothetical protein [Streptomyces boncukensis]